MASWQIVYDLVPLEVDATDPEHPWIGIEHARELLGTFDDVLPRAAGWSPDMVHWGNYESHDIQVWIDGTEVAAIRVRIDLRQGDAQNVIERLASAGLSLGAGFRDESGSVTLPDANALAENVRSSRAALFVADPQRYLATISREPYNDR